GRSRPAGEGRSPRRGRHLHRRQPAGRPPGRVGRRHGRPCPATPDQGSGAMSPAAWAAFVVAGAVGAPVRYLVDGVVGDRVGGAFPWGTLVVNATGSLL